MVKWIVLMIAEGEELPAAAVSAVKVRGVGGGSQAAFPKAGYCFPKDTLAFRRKQLQPAYPTSSPEIVCKKA